MLTSAILSDLDAISDIHMDSITGSVSVLMGKKFVKNLYQTLFNDDNSTILVYKENNELIGFITYTTDFRKTNEEIKTKFSLSQMLIFLLKVTTNIHTMKLFIQQFLFHLYFPNHRIQGYIFIFTLAIKSRYRKQGIGTKLIKHIKIISRKSHSSIFLDTAGSNQKAINFYQKAGFHQVFNAFDNIGFLYQP